MEKRSAKELEAISKVCEANGVDPARMLADESCDLLECGRRLKMIRAVRAGMQPRILRTAG